MSGTPCVRSRRLAGGLFLALLLISGAAARAAEMIVVRVVLNEVPKGELFTLLEPDGGISLKLEDLAALGLKDAAGSPQTIEGETWVPLRSIPRISFRLDPATLTLHLTAAASYFPPNTLDLLPKRLQGTIRPRESSAFFNYRLDYTGGKALRLESFSFGQEMGARTGDFLFLTDGRYERTPDRDRWIRLSTSLTRDDRTNLTRLVAGDFVGTSGLLGSALSLGGVSYSRSFRIDPYLITRPLFGFTGSALTPSQVEVYLDGQRIATQAFPSGTFSLRNIVGYTGARTLEVVVRDAAGREERFLVPFYFSDVILARGLSDFSYSLGAPRRNLGQASADYGPLTFLGYHRWGISDALTLGARAEANRDGFNAGPEAGVVLGRYGTVTAAANLSAARGRSAGFSGALSWVYAGPVAGGRLFTRTFSPDYATVDETPPLQRTRTEVGAGLNVSTRGFGSLSIDYTRSTRLAGPLEESLVAGYNRQLWRSIHLRLNARWVGGGQPTRQLFVGVSAYPWAATTVSAGVRSEDGKESVALDALRSVPLGEGFGYGVSVGLPLSAQAEGQGSANVQYKGKYGLFSAGLALADVPGSERIETYSLSAAGGIGWTREAIALTRPIADSFGVARVGDLPGVRVYQNGQLAGRTNALGKVFLPELASYLDNQISIENRDIPMEYSVPALTKSVSPPFRSGSVITFEAARIQGVTGIISARVGETPVPLEFAVFSLEVGGQPREYATGKGGEFYIENLPPGRHSGTATPAGRPCRFVLDVPVTNEFIAEIPPVVCEPAP
jgi:outer membrane usher protein